MPGIEPGASYMQSMRSTTELHPLSAAELAYRKPHLSSARTGSLWVPGASIGSGRSLRGEVYVPGPPGASDPDRHAPSR